MICISFISLDFSKLLSESVEILTIIFSSIFSFLAVLIGVVFLYLSDSLISKNPIESAYNNNFDSELSITYPLPLSDLQKIKFSVLILS